MGMFGLCPCCKEWKSLTKHHDKRICKIILVCRSCHDIIEEYIKIQARAESYES